MRIHFGTILSILMRRRINENMVWTDSQDYGADEILYTIGTVFFNINNRLMREIAILFEVYPQLFPSCSKECTFLGYTIGSKGKLWMSKKSKERIKTRIKTLTKRNRGRKLEAVIKELNQTLRGWLMYFRLAEAKRWCKETEGWLHRKLRCYRLKQCKRRIGIARFPMQNRCTEHQAWETAMCRNGWWRKSQFAQANKAMGNEWFRNLGLIPFALLKS